MPRGLTAPIKQTWPQQWDCLSVIILTLNSSQFQNMKHSGWGIAYFCSDFKQESQNNRGKIAAILSMKLAPKWCLCNASVPDSHLYRK